MIVDVYHKRQQDLAANHVKAFQHDKLTNVLNNDPVFDLIFKEDEISGAASVSSYLRLRKSLAPEIQEYVERNLKGIVIPPTSTNDDYVLQDVEVTHAAQVFGVKAVADAYGIDSSNLSSFVDNAVESSNVKSE